MNQSTAFNVSIFALFVLNGLQAIVPFMSGTVQIIVSALIAGLVVVTHNGVVASAKAGLIK